MSINSHQHHMMSSLPTQLGYFMPDPSLTICTYVQMYCVQKRNMIMWLAVISFLRKMSYDAILWLEAVLFYIDHNWFSSKKFISPSRHWSHIWWHSLCLWLQCPPTTIPPTVGLHGLSMHNVNNYSIAYLCPASLSALWAAWTKNGMCSLYHCNNMLVPPVAVKTLLQHACVSFLCCCFCCNCACVMCCLYFLIVMSVFFQKDRNWKCANWPPYSFESCPWK